jgi:C1A family cysteine protease
MGNFQSGSEQSRFPLKIRNTKRYSCIPDIPDQRDIWSTPPKTVEYYQTADLKKTNFLPDVYDQGNIGSSVACAVLASYVFCLTKNGTQNIQPQLSPQFIYYNQRIIANTVECDSGSSIRDGIKVLDRLGVCTEELYPYDQNFFKDKPTEEAYKYAYTNKHSIQYRRIRLLLEEIFKCISLKLPIIMGFTIYDSFQHPDVSRTGIMPIPKLGEKIVGHHAVLIVGYDIPRKFLLCRNSWGSSWGQGGYFWMPFAFINSRNCSDLWIISISSDFKNNVKLTNDTKKEVPKKEKEPEPLIFKKDDESDIEEDIEEDNTIV